MPTSWKHLISYYLLMLFSLECRYIVVTTLNFLLDIANIVETLGCYHPRNSKISLKILRSFFFPLISLPDILLVCLLFEAELTILFPFELDATILHFNTRHAATNKYNNDIQLTLMLLIFFVWWLVIRSDTSVWFPFLGPQT